MPAHYDRWTRFLLLMTFAWIGAGAEKASALTVAFLVNNITYSNTTAPYTLSTGNGLFTWTYQPGDFPNGTGSYVFVNLPPGTVYPAASYGPVYTVDSSLLAGTITQNVDSYWYDFSLNFSPALTAPNSTARLTGGSYDLYVYNNYVGGETMGSVIGGTVTPYTPALSAQAVGAEVIVSWPTNYADGFVLESTTDLTVGSRWTTSSIPVQVLGANYVVTNHVSGSSLFLRLVR